MLPKRLLIVEDDDEIVRLIREGAASLSLELEHCSDGRNGLERALSGSFALVIVDVGLPSLNGFDLCRELRIQRPQQPILLLTSRSDELDKVLGLELGADDYVTKPFSIRELLARARALLRRSASSIAEPERAPALKRIGQLTIDFERCEVTRDGALLSLSTIEFKLLAFLAEQPGRVFSRDELMTAVWGYTAGQFDSTVSSHISRLRSKIEPDPTRPVYIGTVRGFGYRLTIPE